MNRRSFLKIGLAATVAVAIPIELYKALDKRLPIIYGDMIHDDWEGLQAAMTGQEFVCDSGMVTVRDGICYISDGLFKVSKTLHLTGSSQIVMSNCLTESIADPMICMHPEAENNALLGSHFKRPPGAPPTGVGIEVMPREPQRLSNLTYGDYYRHEVKI
jgi:hypothetical protein